MNRPVIVGAGLGLLVLLLGGLWLWQQPGLAPEPQATAPRARPLAAAPASAGSPDWRSAGPMGALLPAPPPPGAAPAQGASATAGGMAAIQQRLQRLAASGHPDVHELDSVLADLQRNQGSAVVAGVDLQALRDNLARSQHIQDLAQQMQALAASPSPETTPKLQALMAEIQRTQSQMQPIGAAVPRASR